MKPELDKTKEWGIVAYTDGGCIPNPGASGCGLHAYIYEVTKESIKPVVLRFVDGDVTRYATPTATGYKACSKNGDLNSSKEKDIVFVKPEHYVEIAESSSNQHTNNYVEMKSYKNAMDLIEEHGFKVATIITDSEYTLKGISQWCAGWERRGWLKENGETPSNINLWKPMWQQYQRIKANDIHLRSMWIKGHSGQPGNIHADDLATIGVNKSKTGLDCSTAYYFPQRKYWEVDRDRHPLLSLKRIYFNRVEEHNTPGHYYMGDPGKDDALVGKRLPESVYAVVKMNTPHPVLDAIQRKQYTVGQDLNDIMMIKMESVFTHDIYRNIVTHEEHCLRKAKNSTNIEFVDRRPLTIERKPIGLTMRAMDCINLLDDMLVKFEALQSDKDTFGLDNNIDLQSFDITDEFYQFDEKKVGKETVVKQLFKKEFGVGHKSHGVTREVSFPDKPRLLTIPLMLGADVPDRNSLKQLETDNTKVYLITWRDGELSIRYATVITCTSGIAIWSNFYADRLIVKK